MRKISGLLLLLVVLMSSCIKQGDISVKEIEDVSVRSMSNVDMKLSVENLSGHNVKIESAKFRIDKGDKPFMTILLRDRVVIPRRATSSVGMNWAIKMDNPLNALAMMGSLKKSLEGMTVTGEIVAKAGWGGKKIKLDAVPMSQILATFGAQIDDVVKSIGL